MFLLLDLNWSMSGSAHVEVSVVESTCGSLADCEGRKGEESGELHVDCCLV
jgi:hypothetical protein